MKTFPSVYTFLISTIYQSILQYSGSRVNRFQESHISKIENKSMQSWSSRRVFIYILSSNSQRTSHLTIFFYNFPGRWRWRVWGRKYAPWGRAGVLYAAGRAQSLYADGRERLHSARFRPLWPACCGRECGTRNLI